MAAEITSKSSPKQAGTSDREPFREIAHPSKHKRLSIRPHIPDPPPSLADEITRAEPMSTFNALASQPKKGTILLYEKYWDSCIVEFTRELA